MALVLPLMAVSCAEPNEETDELADWKNRNETYFKSLYEKAKSNPSRYKIIRNYSLEEPVAQNAEDNIIVEVLNEGTGTSSPLYTDSVRVHYRGSYIPTASWPAGYVFDQSWTGDYNLETMCPATFAVSSVIDGFTTALLNMKPGDRWRVTIPYNLAYGESDYSSGSGNTIPGYSTLTFDLTLVAYYRPGTVAPPVSAKPDWGWVGE